MHITTRTRAALRAPAWIRGAVPILLSLSILWLLRDTVQTIDANAALKAVLQTSAWQWFLAAVLTFISFFAIAQYDRLIAPQTGLDLLPKLSQGAGWRATAISQVLGYGLITGALTRWRTLGRPAGVSLWDCSRLTLGVTCAFFAGWGVVRSAAILFASLPSLGVWPTSLAALGLIATATCIALCIIQPKALAAHMPPLRLILPIIVYTALDTLAAATIIYVFLPADYVPFLMLYAAFLIAFGAGMISGLPAGIGAFELAILALLAPAESAPLLSAIVAYRMTYYALPAIIAGLSLIATPRVQASQQSLLQAVQNLPAALATHAPAELDLVAQNQLTLLTDRTRNSAALWHRAPNSDIVLGDPISADHRSSFLSTLKANAQSAGRGFGLYKCSASTAVQANSQGFLSIKIASEGIISTQSFNTKGTKFRQLRRKLRLAAKADITVDETPPPYDALTRIDAQWQARCGTPRGFSMGDLCPKLLARQRLFVARQNNTPIAFITVLTGPSGWTLDIMRVPTHCPDGTAHALVNAAINAAGNEQIPCFSLAAAPFYLPDNTNTLSERAVRMIYDNTGQSQGLARFKTSFAPDWQPRYIAASSPLTLCYMALDLWHLIRSDPQAGAANRQASS